MNKKETITHLRTGFNPHDQEDLFKKINDQEEKRAFKIMLQQIDGPHVFMEFLERFDQMQGDTDDKIDQEKKNNIEKSTAITLKKFMPNNFTSSFTVMRQKIEKMIEDGFSFKNNVVEDSPEQKKELVLSPLELIHEQR